jgi:hypothetical protein
MDDDGAKRREGLPEPLVATLADPADHGARVPYLLGLLDGDDAGVRLAAGTALCLVAATDRRLRAVIAERLVDRLDEDAPVEVGHTVNYLGTRYPEVVEEAVSTLEAEARDRARTRIAETWENRPSGAGPTADWAVARTGDAPESEDDGDGDERDRPDSAATHAGDDAAGRVDPRVTTERRGDRTTGSGASDGDRRDDDPGDGAAERRGRDASTGPGVTAETLRTVSRRLSTVVQASEFDDLTVLSEGRRDRYGDVYRAAGRLDGSDYAVALTVYRERGTHASFVAAFRRVMAAWRELSDHRAVLPVYAWSPRPRPWAAIEYAGGPLATHGDPARPLWTVLELASALAHAHQHGVVHGAVDPGNVVYRDVEFDGTDRQPLLTNFGVASLPDETERVTGTETQANRPWGVDPRYAAPEHYDEDYGRVDGATDVYCLGALCYRLVTGEHPYSGDTAAVRERVLSGPRPLPGRVDPDLPDALDDVLRKATAKPKIKRYETVTAFERELRGVASETGGEGGDV